jgi:glycosyltransferase involved in cell wall biosynthesis
VNGTIIHAADFSAAYAGNFLASLTTLREVCRQHDLDTIFLFPPQARERAWCQRLMESGQKVYFLFPRIAGAREIARAAPRDSAVVLHTHFTQYDVAASLASKLLRLGGRTSRVVWHVHSELRLSNSPARWMKNFFKYRCLGRGVWAVPVADPVRDQVLAAGVPAARVRTIYNAVHLQRATQASRMRQETLAALGLEDRGPVLLMFGWEPLRKGVDLALEAVGRLAETGCRVTLLVVGTHELPEFVRTRTGGHPPPWLRVVDPVENVADLYQAATLFLSPSRSEGLPYSVCEAMANRLPVVLSDIPAVAWARVTPGAVFVPPGDSFRLAEAIGGVLAWDAETRQQCGAANQALIEREFDVRAWAEKVLCLYQEILSA